MEQMEQAIQQLFQKNDQLMSECENLKRLNEQLTAENEELHKKMKEPCRNCAQNRLVESDVPRKTNGSAASADTNPLPKGSLNKQTSARDLDVQRQKITVEALWKIVLACLLYQTCSMKLTGKSTCNPLNKSLKVCSKISPPILKQLLRKQILK